MTGGPYLVELLAPACRAVAERLPEVVAAAVLELCSGPLAEDPAGVGKPLFGPLDGCHGAWRGTYRVVYRIDEGQRLVSMLDIAHRRDVYGHR